MALFAAAGLVLSMAGLAPAKAGSKAESKPEPRPIRLVALGDSLTAGYQLPAASAFPAVLERALAAKGTGTGTGPGRTVTVANAGVSGETATNGLDRVDWSVPDGTDGVILELGANDMLRGTDPAVTRKALEAIVVRLKDRGIPVLLAGMRASTNLGPDYVARFDAIYPDLARKYDLVLYPFFMAGMVGDRAYTLDDGLHPNAKGVDVIVAGILPSVETFLGRLQPAAH